MLLAPRLQDYQNALNENFYRNSEHILAFFIEEDVPRD
jgi:hypothetical protein